MQQEQQQQRRLAGEPGALQQQPLRPQPRMVARAGAAMAVCVAGLLLFIVVFFRSPALMWCAAAAEVAFCVHYWALCVPRYTSSAVCACSPEDHDPAATKACLLRQLERVEDVGASLSSWFVNAEPGQVKRGNVRELMAYAVYYRTMAQMEAEGLMPELDAFMTELEQRLGYSAPEGYTPGLRFISHLWDPLNHVYRPLVFYVVMEMLALVCHCGLLAAGFRHHRMGDVSYYSLNVGPQKVVRAISSQLSKRSRSASTRSLAGAADGAPTAAASKHHQEQQQQQQQQAQVPIVFLHGVGAGLLPYLAIVFRLAAVGAPMVLPHSKHVSMRLIRWMPTVDDMADATAAILAAHGMDRAAVVAHSYGTMVASRLVLKYDGLVHSLCLTDPVCFAMFMPDLVRNFLVTRHACGFWAVDLIMLLVSSELHCAAHFSRGFFWTSINLWEEHIPERTLVVLSGRDILAPTAHVHKWLKEHTHAQVMYSPNLPHAGMLLNWAWQETALTTFVEVMQRPLGAVQAAAAAAAGGSLVLPAPEGEDEQRQQQEEGGGSSAQTGAPGPDQGPAAAAGAAGGDASPQLRRRQQHLAAARRGSAAAPPAAKLPAVRAGGAAAALQGAGSGRSSDSVEDCMVHLCHELTQGSPTAAARITRKHPGSERQQEQQQPQHQQQAAPCGSSKQGRGAAAGGTGVAGQAGAGTNAAAAGGAGSEGAQDGTAFGGQGARRPAMPCSA